MRVGNGKAGTKRAVLFYLFKQRTRLGKRGGLRRDQLLDYKEVCTLRFSLKTLSGI